MLVKNIMKLQVCRLRYNNKNIDFKIESLFTQALFYMDQKIFWTSLIWKNCNRKEINKYINLKINKYGRLHPRQQNVFDKCVFETLKKNELVFLDHNLVGLPHSKFILQNKNTKEGWYKLGKPDYKICNFK